jgi:hypothetical protein
MYADPELTIECDDLAAGCYITIRNPQLCAPEDLVPRRLPMNADGTPRDMREARKAVREVLGSLVTGWLVWDAKTGEELPSPAEDPSVIHRAPSFVLTRLDDEFAKAMRPPS